MNLFSTFHLGAGRILSQGHSVPGRVTMARKSYLYVIKKPVRLYLNEKNTMYSHFITFQYTVDSTSYKGKLFIPPQHRCPCKGDTIEVFYDPEKPERYACYSFGPNLNMIGW